MSRAVELRKLGWTVRPCRFCGRDVLFAKDDAGTTVCLDPTPPCYSLHGDLEGCSRLRGAYVSHHATCKEFHRQKQAERLPAREAAP